MSFIVPVRQNLRTQDVAYRRSVSEIILSKVGSSINFINDFQYDSKAWFLNGPYSIVTGAQTGVDGAYFCAFNMEIVGVIMFNLVKGSSGTTTIDIRRFTAPNTPTGGASIFSVKPSIASTASNNTYVGRIITPDAVTIANPAGTTLPTLLTTQLNQGDMLTCNIDSKMSQGQSAGLVLFLKPR
jgi:hypothetical protein